MTREVSILCSFHYFRKKSLAGVVAQFPAGTQVRVFADSGAFSAKMAGARIRLADYARWLHDNRAVIHQYANLDAIGDPVTTWRNQRVLQLEGFRPVPVFHVGSDWSHLERIADEERERASSLSPERVALGGMVPFLREKRKVGRWIREAFSRVPGARVHGFGCGSWELARAFPWASVDSSTWTVASKYRHVCLFDERSSAFRQVRGYRRSDYPRMMELAARYGVSAKSLCDGRSVEARKARERVNVAEFFRMEAAKRAASPDFRYYFAISGAESIRMLAGCCE